MQFHASWRKMAGGATRASILVDGAEVQPLRMCIANCSHEGVCVDKGGTPRCLCPPGRSGEGCEAEDASACFLGCSGRGACHRGVCVCADGWFGLGCTEQWLDEAELARRGAAAAPRHELAIYVWQPPTQLILLHFFSGSVDTSRQFPGGAKPGGGLVEFAFLHSLMEDKMTRVATPWEANLFYVPTFFTFGGEPNVRRIMGLIG